MTLIWCRVTVEIFFRMVRTVLRNLKNVQERLFGYFGADFGYVTWIPATRFLLHKTHLSMFLNDYNITVE